jgi:hypothetical protein
MSEDKERHLLKLLCAATASLLLFAALSTPIDAQPIGPNVYNQLRFRHIGPRANRLYYSRMVVAPDNEEEIYFQGVRQTVSYDGGKTAQQQRPSPGGDNHNMWTDPLDLQGQFDALMPKDVPDFNRMLREKNLKVISISLDED